MPRDETRKLLKTFGVAVTDYEDAVEQILARAREAARTGDARGVTGATADLLRAAADLNARWAEMGGFLAETQGKAFEALQQVASQTAGK